ncbi:MAG: DMT family transporter [Sphingomonadaceae bacterium]|nr:DMT family transporter [Sphingomonadaceae bacterium]
MTSARAATTVPFAAACLGIALFSGMDAAMKGLSIALGAYNAMFWRVLIGVGISGVPYAMARAAWPTAAAMRVHLIRGAVTSVMAIAFFYGIARVPLAEGIALSFIAPLIALYLAAVLLGETIGRATIVASLIALTGVGILVATRLSGDFGPDSLPGVAAILFSAVFYAWNIILMRQQALLALPTEVAFFQNVTVSFFLGLAAPFLAVVPSAKHLPALGLSAALAFASLLLLSWAYARAEAKILVPVEYTAFIWAAIMGAIVFGEAVTPATLAGAALIVTGCIVAARAGRTDTAKLEAAL